MGTNYKDIEKIIITKLLDSNKDTEKVFNNFNDLSADHFNLEICRKTYNWIKDRMAADQKISIIRLQQAEILKDQELAKLIDFKAGPDIKLLTDDELIDLLEKRKADQDKAKLKEKLAKLVEAGADPEEFTEVVKNLKTKCKEWPDVIPLNEITPEPLPVSILPGWLSRYVNNISMFLQVPSDMVLLIALSAVATAVANKAIVEIKPGYQEPVNLWTLSILPPANRKSPVVKKLSKPIWNYESQIREEIGPERRHLIQEKEILEDRIQRLQKAAAKQEDAGKRSNTIGRMNQLGDDIDVLEEEIPALPRILVDDITSEKLAQVMEENQGRAAILSAEGDIFQLMAGRYSKSTNFSVFKKAWSSEQIIDDRIGRKGTAVENPVLTMGICAQPAVIEELTDKNSFRGEGIIGRFIFSIPESPVGSRLTGDDVPELDQRVEQQYINNMHKLLRSEPLQKEGQHWKPHKLKLSAEALQIRNKFEADVEKMLGPEGKLHYAADWGGKLVGNMTRVSGLLHIAVQVDSPGIWVDKEITAKEMQGAVNLGHTLIDHALKVFDLLDVNPELELTKYVLKRIVKGYEMQRDNELPKGKDKLDKAALYQLTRKKNDISKPEDLDKPLERLEKMNYIKVIKREHPGPGRPPAPIIKVNPQIGTFNTINTIN